MRVLSVVFYLLFLPVSSSNQFYSPTSHIRQSPAPPLYDLRKSNRIQSVINQRKCGACYLSAAATALQYWSQLPISEQNLLNCASHFQCRGGFASEIFEWATQYDVPIGRQPFFGDKKDCVIPKTNISFRVKESHIETNINENEIEQLIWKFGPITTYMYINDNIMLYHGGIIEPYSCTEGLGTYHSISIVGYTPDAWIVKNSWGKQWGESGFGFIRKGKHACGLGRRVEYVKSVALYQK